MRLFFIPFIFILTAFPLAAFAAVSYTVTPAIVDESGIAGNSFENSITITNNHASRKFEIFPTVNNIAIEDGRQEFIDPSRADQATSLANWIEISRGVIELAPGEAKEMSFFIKISPYAKPGMYHAVISFPFGSFRSEAERLVETAPSVFVNVEVREDIRENMLLRKFIPDKTFFSNFPATFSYDIENVGNRPVTPSGTITIYDRAGKEVAVIDAAENAAALHPDASRTLASAWGGARQFGRYKAVLDLAYGSNGASVRDITFFWVIPWEKLLALFGGLSVAVIGGALLLHKIYLRRRKHIISALPHFSAGTASHSDIKEKQPKRVIDLRKKI